MFTGGAGRNVDKCRLLAASIGMFWSLFLG